MAADVRLHPTPNRLDILADAIQDRLFGPSHEVDELEAAGWIEPYPPPSSRYRATAYGRAIAAIRVLNFRDEITVDCGGADQPRRLATATRGHGGRQWVIRIGNTSTPVNVRSKHALREELRHLAASLLAAELEEARA
jgi:hypothetical protein